MGTGLSLDAVGDRRHGVTFVRAVLENEVERRQRVELVATGGGPVWPPRRRGVPAAGWDEDGVEVVLDAGESRALGYATPATPGDPPLRMAAVTAAQGDIEEGERSTGDAVRDLDDPVPPRQAVPEPASPRPGATASDVTSEDRGGPVEHPPVVERIRQAEALATAGSLPGATRALAAVGGLDAARRLRGRLAADAVRLRHRAARARALAERAERVEVPIERLERLS